MVAITTAKVNNAQPPYSYQVVVVGGGGGGGGGGNTTSPSLSNLCTATTELGTCIKVPNVLF